MYEELRKAFVKRLTVDSPHHDARCKDFNQAIFDAEEGFACFNGTDPVSYTHLLRPAYPR